MYLARFSAAGADVAQGAVELSFLSPALPGRVRTRWSDTAGQLAEGLLAAATQGASLRAMLTPGASLDVTLTGCAPADEEPRLRRALGAFSRLETVVPGSVRLPPDRASFDRASDRFPPLRVCVTSPRYWAQDAWLACDFRLLPTLWVLLEEADALGHRLGYHASLQAVVPGPGDIRAARLNHLAVAELAGVPARLVDMQRELVDHLTRVRWMLREYVAVDDERAGAWVLEAVARRFRRQFGPVGFDDPAWAWEEAAFEDELTCPACVRDPVDVDELCASGVNDDNAARVLAWEPPPDAALSFAPDGVAGLELPDGDPPTTTLPPPYDGTGRYLFVSYRHTDLDAIVPVLKGLQELGWNLWYDRGIPGGSEWNAVLEERLASADAVLLFVSQAAVASKYVRREVLFADSLDKRIVGVQLERVRLEHGMGLLLGQAQLLRRSDPGFLARLERALALAAAA